jgi:hypothetical protein
MFPIPLLSSPIFGYEEMSGILPKRAAVASRRAISHYIQILMLVNNS